MNESEPLMTCRKCMDDIKTEAVWSWPGMSLGATCLLPRWCPAWRGHDLAQALVRNVGTLSPTPTASRLLVARGRTPRGRNPEVPSTVAGDKGRTASQ